MTVDDIARAAGEDHFGEAVAAHYDEAAEDMFEPALLAETVGLLAELAAGGPALEFGIGTGRVALPLSQRIAVHGIDLSRAMLAQLRAKPGAAAVGATLGDFATVRVPSAERFSLVYLVFNTIMNLTTQEAQVQCFQNAAVHLRRGGHFLVEVMVPDLRRLPPGETVRPFSVTPQHLGFDEYDVVNQGLVSHHHRLSGGRWDVVALPFRYVWPAELDLMARLSGLSLRQRWGGWTRQPFTADSRAHVSVWEKL